MLDWKHQLGHEFLTKGALTYIISDEGDADLDSGTEVKQLPDMIVIYKDHVEIIELKETNNTYRKAIKYTQVARYQHLREDFKGKSEFWAYVYWNQTGYITGSFIRQTDSINFFTEDSGGERPDFKVSIGTDKKTRVEKKVDYILKIKPGEMTPIKKESSYAM